MLATHGLFGQNQYSAKTQITFAAIEGALRVFAVKTLFYRGAISNSVMLNVPSMYSPRS